VRFQRGGAGLLSLFLRQFVSDKQITTHSKNIFRKLFITQIFIL